MADSSRATAPAPLAPLPFQIPSAFSHSFSNGLKLIHFEDKRLPLVSYRLAFFSGDAQDSVDNIGLASATASMLTEGTEAYSSRELAEKIERLGASLSAHASDDFTIVSASSLSLYTMDVLDLIEEVVLRPTFPEQELDLYRRNAIEHLRFQRSQPNFLANEQTARLLYGEHPYSRVSPSSSDIEKLSQADLQSYQRRTYVPNNAIFIVVGDIGREELISSLNDRLGGWAMQSQPAPVFPPLPERSKRTLTIVDRAGSAQSNIVLSNLAINRTHPDYFPVLVMNQVLGAGASSRVFMNLREEKGYTYGAYTRFDAKRFGGDFEATAEVRTGVTGDSLREFFYELNRIREERVSEQEIADAKNFLTGVFPIRAETQEGLTNLLVTQFLYDLPDDYLQTYRDKVAAVTADEIRDAARKYVCPAELAMVIVGDADEILKQTSEYAEDIEVFDTEGNPKALSSYSAEGTETAAVAGNWELTIDFQGQSVPVTLTLNQSDGVVSGTLETAFGNGEISDGSVSGNKLSATAVTEFQGQKLDLTISGKISGDAISGSLTAPIMPAAMTFTGTRKTA
jgi:zinc protease